MEDGGEEQVVRWEIRGRYGFGELSNTFLIKEGAQSLKNVVRNKYAPK